MGLQVLRNSSYQVATLFAGVALLSMVFVWYWLTIAADDTLMRESEAALSSEARYFQDVDLRGGQFAVRALIDSRLFADGSDWFYALVDPSGAQVGGNLPSEALVPQGGSLSGARFYELAHAAMPEREGSGRWASDHFDLLAREVDLQDGSLLVIARDVDDIEIAQWVASIFGWAMMGMMVLILLLGYGVAYYVASRVRRIAETTNRIIATGNLSERLPVDGEWDDLSKLSALLNSMLSELAARIDGIKSVSDSIAHDLRTPLMRLRSAVDTQTDGVVRVSLLDELDRTLELFRSLLRISAIEAGKQPLARSAVALNTALSDVVELYEVLAEEKGVNLRLLPAPQVTLSADRDLIFQVLVNLVDNAVKFTPSGGSVVCSLTASAQGALLVIEDSGPGIDVENHSRALERFGRLEESRTQPGHGLGLPLANAIIERHGGQLSLESARPGLRVVISLPISAVDAA